MLSNPSSVVFRKLSPALRIGGSLGIKNTNQDDPDSQMHIPVLVSHYITEDVCETVQLYNTRCKFYNTEGGCNKGWRCPFLHDEEPFDKCVFHNGQEPTRFRTSTSTVVCPSCPVVKSSTVTRETGDTPAPAIIEAGPLCNARIYMGNIPPDCPEDFMSDIGNKFGTVTKVQYLASALRNGRHAGFMFMTSEAQAVATIEEINKTMFSGCELYAKLQDVKPLSRPKKPTPPPTVPIVDEDGFTTHGKLRTAASTPTERAASVIQTTSVWAALMGLDDENEDSEEDATEAADNNEIAGRLQTEEDAATEAVSASLSPVETLQAKENAAPPQLVSLERDSPDSVMVAGPWGDASRSRIVRNGLAHENMFEKDTRKVMKMTLGKEAVVPTVMDKEEEEEWEDYSPDNDFEDFDLDDAPPVHGYDSDATSC